MCPRVRAIYCAGAVRGHGPPAHRLPKSLIIALYPGEGTAACPASHGALSALPGYRTLVSPCSNGNRPPCLQGPKTASTDSRNAKSADGDPRGDGSVPVGDAVGSGGGSGVRAGSLRRS